MTQAQDVFLLDVLQVEMSTPGMLYQKLANNIKAAIDQGVLVEGDFLPPQRDLAADLSLSRVTVTKAIEVLDKQGVVRLIPRQGVQVITSQSQAPIPPKLQLSDQYNFTKDMQARGMVPTTQWVLKDNVNASTHEALTLGIPQNSRVGHYWRLRFADGEPLALEVSCIPSSVIHDCNEVDESLYDALKARDSLPVRATQTITACSADQHTAQHLRVQVDTSVLYIERRGFDKANHCVEYTRYWYLGEQYCFIADMTLSE